jgi:ribonuclease-3
MPSPLSRLLSPWRALERALGYRFRRRELLEEALVHPSYRHEAKDVAFDNQRLEFLGDAALGLAVAAQLYARYPDMAEGELTRLRSVLTQRHTLATVAQELDLGAWLKLGRGEQLSGGSRKASNLADAFEAVLGAAYLDGGLKAVQGILDQCLSSMVDCLPRLAAADNAKGALQEHCQQVHRQNPHYELTGEEGPPHARIYTVEVRLGAKPLGVGVGSNKRAAEQEAAEKAMERLRKEETPGAPAEA